MIYIIYRERGMCIVCLVCRIVLGGELLNLKLTLNECDEIDYLVYLSQRSTLRRKFLSICLESNTHFSFCNRLEKSFVRLHRIGHCIDENRELAKKERSKYKSECMFMFNMCLVCDF